MKTILKTLSLIAFLFSAGLGLKKWYERVIRKSIAAPDRHTSGPDTPENTRKRRQDLLADEKHYAGTPV